MFVEMSKLYDRESILNVVFVRGKKKRDELVNLVVW